MLLTVVVAGLLQAAAVQDSVRLIDSTLVIEPRGLAMSLPSEWFGAKDTVKSLGCGHRLRGRAERRLAITRQSLDSVSHATGEWDREYSAVADSILPSSKLLAHLGPEPFGGEGQCFADLQFRIYLTKSSPTEIGRVAETRGLSTARAFFPSATIAGRDSAEWNIQRLRWEAWYHDYGGEANVEIYSTPLGGDSLVLVFMHVSGGVDGFADRDRRFILTHLKRP
jgi:hypothetical protein